jgi:hypothetical protein
MLYLINGCVLKNPYLMFGGGVWGRDWGATSHKDGTNKTRPPNARFGADWETVWGRDWRCSK